MLNGTDRSPRNRRAQVGWRRHAAAPMALAVVLSTACRGLDERFHTEGRGASAPARAGPRRHLPGSSVGGRPIECLDFGQGEDVVLILATIHGNEAAGTPLVQRLADHIAERPDLLEGRRILLIPVANPDGMARGVRHNARGVDLNRNFPASNYRSAAHHGSSVLSEPESRAIQHVIQTHRPDRIVSIHQPMADDDACIDYDGPAEPLARAMASHTTLPVKKLGGRPGSLGSYAGIELGIPIVTVELPVDASGLDEDALWSRYGRMLLAAIRFPQPVAASGAETRKASRKNKVNG